MPANEPLFLKSDEPLHGNTHNSRSLAPNHRGPVGVRGVSTFVAHLQPTQWAEHSHEQLEIVALFDSAICDFSWRSAEGKIHHQRMGENQLWLIGPGQAHSGIWRHPAGMAILHVGMEFIHDLIGCKMGGVTVHEFSRIARSDLIIWEVATLLKGLCGSSGKHHDLYLESLGTLFASHILRAHFNTQHRSALHRVLTAKQLQCVTDYIDANLKQTVRVQDLAREACLSSYHFIRLFKQTTGLSPHSYLIRSRVLKANELLRGGEYRVAEAAYEVGFCDQSHLDRYFRRHFGFTPKSVLKQRR